MQRKLVVEFSKMNGAGNDFIVLDNRFYHFSEAELSEIARRFCRRRFGIGADGLLGLAVPEDPDHHYRMRYFNADGSLGTMCGNGARCLARFARDAGIKGREMVFESDAGLYRVVVPEYPSEQIMLYVQPPRQFMESRILSSPVAEQVGPLHYIWTGVEHLVCFVPDVSLVRVSELGPELRHDEMLKPAGANVNFVQIIEDAETVARIRTRTYEKGVEAETLACGTGAIASAVVARLLGYIRASTVDVEMPGGTLGVGFKVDGKVVTDVFLSGSAELVYRGTFELEPFL